MGEIRFYSLKRRRLDVALPELLEAALAEGERVVVQAPSAEQAEALNERLWTYRDDGFLPHGSAGDGDPAEQPIYLTDAGDNPNGATRRVFVGGADPEPALAAAEHSAARLSILFDADDEAATAEARRLWTAAKAKGFALSFWREGEDGRFERAR